MINVLVHYETELHWLPQLESLRDRCCVYRDLDQYLASQRPRLALLWYEEPNWFNQVIGPVCQHSDMVMIFSHEPIDLRWIQQYQTVWYVAPVILADPDLNRRMISWQYWLDVTVAANPDAIFSPKVPCERIFDALLGSFRPHRDWIYHNLQISSTRDQILMSYFASGDPHTPRWISINGPIPNPAIAALGHTTVGDICYRGITAPLSTFIDVGIYQSTCASLVAETFTFSEFSFITEKTAKPLLSGRLFVMFANQHFLRDLRSLGFRTFESVIDESYDSIEDPVKRYRAALDQVEDLCRQDWNRLLRDILPTVEHNQTNIRERSWQHRAAQCCDQVIKDFFTVK